MNMGAWTIRQIAEEIGVSVGLAQEISTLPDAPDRSKFRALQSYVARLCKNAVKHGKDHDAILARASARGRARPPAGEAPPPDLPPTTSIDSSSDELAVYERALASCMAIITSISDKLRATTDITAPANLPLIDRLDKLLREARQAIRDVQTFRTDRARLLDRGATLAAVSSLWITFRTTLDTLVNALAEDNHLPAWILDAGGQLPPDRRAFAALIRDHVYALVADEANALTAALTAITDLPPSPPVRADLRRALAAQLRAHADTLEATPE